MKTTTLIIGDEHGLRSLDDRVVVEAPRYRGPTGQKAMPDPAFIEEMIRRRSALKLSAVGLGRETPLADAYIAMIENGSRTPSDEAKQKIRDTLDRLENEEITE